MNTLVSILLLIGLFIVFGFAWRRKGRPGSPGGTEEPSPPEVALALCPRGPTRDRRARLLTGGLAHGNAQRATVRDGPAVLTEHNQFTPHRE